MSDENEQGLSDWDIQQDQIDQVALELEVRLRLDRAEVIEALLDWVYVNADIEWLDFAAKDDVAGLSDYHTGSLQEFIEAATQAWRKASGEEGHLGVSDVLEQIEDLIDVYREQKKHERRD